ncbi:MAG: hypothetical protein Q8P67_18625 [archaeon]|nr:hypothetical protein [archaeon]
MERGTPKSTPAMLFLLCLGLLCLAGSCSGFNLRPNVRGQEEASAGGVTCVFRYEAVGGTSEVWEMELRDAGAGGYSCVIGRPDQASYLVFLSYEVAVSGGAIKDVLVVDGEARPLFEGEHFVLDREANLVRPHPSFQASIQGIMVDIVVTIT